MVDIFTLSDEAVDRVAADDPLLATWFGIDGHHHAWPDLSPEGIASRRELFAGLRAEADAAAAPDDRHELARRALVGFCAEITDPIDADDHHYALNNIESPHQDMRFVYGSQPKGSADDWEAVIQRLATIERPIAGYRATLEEGRQIGHLVSRRQVAAAVTQGRTAVAPGSSFDQLRAELDQARRDGLDVTPGLEQRLDEAIEGAKTAFDGLTDYLEQTYLPEAVEADPVGPERYARAARRFLGTDLDLVATYRWGWDEVERLWRAMQAACADVDADAPMADVVDRLTTSPDYGVQDPERFVQLMLERQQQALADLDGVHFDVPPEIRDVDVRLEPAGGALGAHYVGPSEDFSRPGAVWYTFEPGAHIPLFKEISTAYHEGFPGHHLQVGVQATLADELSRFHRMLVWSPGSGEGWALYAEHLMGELGYLERPEYVVGLLSSQLLRACRVAIDIGSHLELAIPDDVSFHPGERWTFDLACELLVERALESPASARSEVTRYLGWPGQAIAYKVGEQAILDLRAEREAGGGFDAKRFHADVLAVGSVGLDLLRSTLTGRWSASGRRLAGG